MDGTLTSVNRSAERLIGLSREQIVGRPFIQFLTPASVALGEERIQRALAGEPLPSTFEIELLRSNGRTVAVEARTRFLRDREGMLVGILGIYRDITERKHAEEALRQAHAALEQRVQERTADLARANEALRTEVIERKRAEEAARAAEHEYRTIFENAVEGIYRSSLDGRQLRANPALVKLNGYESEAEMLPAVSNIAAEWYVDPHRREEFQHILAGRDSVTDFESEVYRHKTRERIWISETARLVRDQHGAPLYYEGTVQDITARKRAEEALQWAHRELEQRVEERTVALVQANAALQAEIEERKHAEAALERLRQQNELILNSAGEGIFGVDEHGRATFVNPTAAHLLGYEVFELLGQPLHERIHHHKADGTLYPAEACPMLHTLHDGRSVRITEEVYWRKDGTNFPVEYLSTPIRNEHGEVVGAVVTFRNITERKEVERVKDELISTVSHELRTPLASLRGFAELMLKRNFTFEKQRELLDVIHSEAIRLTHLIDDFLDLQRIEGGHHPYVFAPLALESVLHESVELFEKIGGPHSLRLEVPSLLPRVRGDANRLRQVLVNLVSNAIKFSPQGGPIEVGAEAETHRVMVWVKDHGVGIPPEAIPKLFTKFFRVDNSDTRGIGGTGLGLALVREIIHAHQGNVWVESTLKSGSTFFFTLPFTRLDT